jgi:hypothetical protein
MNSCEINNITWNLIERWDNIDSLKDNYSEFVSKILSEVVETQYEDTVFRTVPWVMDQAILYKDQISEIRVHSFLTHASDTYIHNHRNPFLSICLDWWYKESIWGIEQEEWINTYQFNRSWGWNIALNRVLNNYNLKEIANRVHKKGNILITDSSVYHSIAWLKDEVPPVTFILKHLRGKEDNQKWIIYSNNKIIEQASEPIRCSVIKEQERIKLKIEEILNIF